MKHTILENYEVTYSILSYSTASGSWSASYEIEDILGRKTQGSVVWDQQHGASNWTPVEFANKVSAWLASNARKKGTP